MIGIGIRQVGVGVGGVGVGGVGVGGVGVVGRRTGAFEGELDGRLDGRADGRREGRLDGLDDGLLVGTVGAAGAWVRVQVKMSWRSPSCPVAAVKPAITSRRDSTPKSDTGKSTLSEPSNVTRSLPSMYEITAFFLSVIEFVRMLAETSVISVTEVPVLFLT